MDVLDRIIGGITWEHVLANGFRILLVLVGVRVAMGVANRLLETMRSRLVERDQKEGQPPTESAKRAETLIRLLRQGIRIMVWLMAGLVILRELGVEVGPILASAGIAGVAIGFGAQNLVRDVISGFFMILENQVRVGDVAVINGTGGLVERIGFRTTVLRDLEGTVHVFPNGLVTTLANRTQEWSAFVFEFGVAYKEDTDRVVELLKAEGALLRQDATFGPLILEDVEVFGVDAFADSAVIIKGRIKTMPIKQWEVGRQFRRRVKQAFDREGIEIPFPHRSIYFGEASKPFVTAPAAAPKAPKPRARAKKPVE